VALDLQTISDRMEIEDLLTAYSIAIDSKQFDDLLPLFTEDAVCDYGSLGSPKGPSAIADLIHTTLKSLDATQHLLGKSVIVVDGDAADVRTYLISQHIRDAAPGEKHYFIGGEYIDTMVRTPDGWKFQTRRLSRMWTQGDRAVIQRST
jgi:hypothetical protein